MAVCKYGCTGQVEYGGHLCHPYMNFNSYSEMMGKLFEWYDFYGTTEFNFAFSDFTVSPHH